MSTPAPAAPPRGTTWPRFLLGTLLGGLGFVALWQAHAPFVGGDLHTTRVLASGGVLFLTGVGATLPGRWSALRVALVLLGVGVAVGLWWGVPSPEGRSLGHAVREREQLRTALAAPGDIPSPRGLRVRLLALEADYPTLTAPVMQQARDWSDRAAEELGRRFDELPPDRVNEAAELRSRARELASAFPETERPVIARADAWADRAAARQVELLGKLGPAEVTVFNRGAADRAAIAAAFPATRDRLIRAEDAWADRTVADVIGQKGPLERYRVRRQTLAEATPLPRNGPAFLSARRALFDATLDAAREYTRALVVREKYEDAFGVARAFAVDWFEDAQVLQREAEVVQFRDGHRYLAALAGKSTPPDEFAPPPRPK